MKKIIVLLSLLLINCGKEKLNDNSVVEGNLTTPNPTSLDTYILSEITKPYGIEVIYRWDANNAPKGSYVYPPSAEKVQEVLETIKHLWLETYTLPNIGGADFMKGKNPIQIILYGGANLDENGTEIITDKQSSAVQMRIYNVNDFNSKDYAKVFILMRSVHHQFAKRLAELFPYNRDNFLKISQKKYVSNTQNFKRNDISRYIRNISQCERSATDDYIYIVESDADYTDIRKGFFSVGKTLPVKKVEKRYCTIIRGTDYVDTEGNGAHRDGFFTLHSKLSAEDEFAEIISATLTHTKSEIDNAINIAQTPLDAAGDLAVQQEYNKRAEEAYAQITQKKAFVEEYFKTEIGINLLRMQTISIQRIRAYVNR